MRRVFGNALANLLIPQGGRYSIVLPPTLRGEARDLVDRLNSRRPRSAFLVLEDEASDPDFGVINQADLLAWRTEEDRVFVLLGDRIEPDTSFASAVTTFLTPTFPGPTGGTVQLSQVARACASEALAGHGVSNEGRDALGEVAEWVADALEASLAETPPPEGRWNWRLLELLALVFGEFADQLDIASSRGVRCLNPQDAWEAARLAGLPLPSKAFPGWSEGLTELTPLQAAKLAHRLVDCLGEETAIRRELARLLPLNNGPSVTSAWETFDWQGAVLATNERNTVPETIRRLQRVGGPNSAPSIIGHPSPPPNIEGAWWSVDASTLNQALGSLKRAVDVAWEVPDHSLLTDIGDIGGKKTLLLNSRRGTPSNSGRTKAKVLCQGITINLSAGGQTMAVNGQGTGNLVFSSPRVNVKPSTGVSVGNECLAQLPDGRIELTFDLSLSFQARTAKSVMWRSSRKIEIAIELEESEPGQPPVKKTLVGTFPLILPSPYCHTIVCNPKVGKPAHFPPATARFSYDLDFPFSWAPNGGTPDIFLSAPSIVDLWSFDGRFEPATLTFAEPVALTIEGLEFTTPVDEGLTSLQGFRLDTDVTLAGMTEAGATDVAAIKLGIPPKVPINILKRRSGQVRSSAGSRVWSTGFGRYQRALVAPEAFTGAGSLFQMVVPSGPGSPFDPSPFGRLPSADPSRPRNWLEIGDGPSESLAATEEWRQFNAAAQRILAIALHRGGDPLLAEANFDSLTTGHVSEYVRAHQALVETASNTQDKFWASFPFSVLVVGGVREEAQSFNRLLSVFLSPLHPARLAWLHATLLHRDACGEDECLKSLLGFASGWDIPAMVDVPGPAGAPRHFIAQPLDPGPEGEYAHWSALVATADNALKLPPVAAGWDLPWGGRTGLDDSAVHRAISEYVDAHPHATSLVVELRSPHEARRSTQVDRAVMTRIAEAAQQIGGTALVLDSPRRSGNPPDREEYLRCGAELDHPAFAWKVRDASDKEHIDIAFIENAAPIILRKPSNFDCPSPDYPIRRFPIVSGGNDNISLDYRLSSNDALGLAGLLRVIEPAGGAKLVIVPSAESLVTKSGVRWEVVGDINIDPAQMAYVVSRGEAERFLWEWRPGWLAISSSEMDCGHGSHYVIARVPASVVSEFQSHLALPEARTQEVLNDLGARGIGLLALGDRENVAEAAASVFFASRLLVAQPDQRQGKLVPLPPKWFGREKSILVGMLSMGTAAEPIAALAGVPNELDADLVLFVAFLNQGVVRVHPVVARDRLPSRKALGELTNSFLNLATNISLPAGENDGDALRRSVRLQAFASLLDFSFRALVVSSPDEEKRAELISRLLAGGIRVEAGYALAFSFSDGSQAVDGLAIRTEHDDKSLNVICDPARIEALLWIDGAADDRQTRLRASLDQALLNAGPSGTPSNGAGIPPCPPTPRPDLGEAGQTELEEDSSASIPPLTPEHQTEPASPAPAEGPGAPDPDIRDIVPEPPGEQPATPTSQNMDFLGAETSTRYTVIGQLQRDARVVALDLDQPKAIGVFGYMGSGKSYLVGALLEATVEHMEGLNALPRPLASVVFNYRRNAADRFELASLASANEAAGEVELLRSNFGAQPSGLSDVHVLCLPGELQSRAAEYLGISAHELAFRPSSLDVEDWELLMGEPGSEAVFARATRAALQELRRQGQIDVPRIREILQHRLPRNSLAAAELRLDFVETLVSASGGAEISDIVRPGRVTVIDLRQPMFNQRDAMKLILVCANQLAKIQGRFNKVVVFDEAHEYMTEEFGQRFDARIRYMRHEGTSYVFASQDVGSIPAAIRRHLGTQFVFSLETQDNIEDMVRFSQQFRSLKLAHLPPGTCYVSSTISTGNHFAAPRLIRVRPRATSHGGRSRIDSHSDE